LPVRLYLAAGRTDVDACCTTRDIQAKTADKFCRTCRRYYLTAQRLRNNAVASHMPTPRAGLHMTVTCANSATHATSPGLSSVRLELPGTTVTSYHCSCGAARGAKRSVPLQLRRLTPW